MIEMILPVRPLPVPEMLLETVSLFLQYANERAVSDWVEWRTLAPPLPFPVDWLHRNFRLIEFRFQDAGGWEEVLLPVDQTDEFLDVLPPPPSSSFLLLPLPLVFSIGSDREKQLKDDGRHFYRPEMPVSSSYLFVVVVVESFFMIMIIVMIVVGRRRRRRRQRRWRRRRRWRRLPLGLTCRLLLLLPPLFVIYRPGGGEGRGGRREGEVSFSAGVFQCGLEMFQSSFRAVSVQFQGNFRAISEQFQGSFRAVSGQFQGSFRKISG